MGIEQILAQLLAQQMGGGGFGGVSGFPQQPQSLQVGMKVRVRNDVNAINRASRSSIP